MPWDPATLQINSVTIKSPVSGKVTNGDNDAVLEVDGAGLANVMFGVLMLHVEEPSPPSPTLLKRESVIPCNDIELQPGGFTATLRLCPRQKTPGEYDLILWCAPPPFVVDEHGNKQTNVATNDVAFLMKAFTLTHAENVLSREEKAARIAADAKVETG